MTKIILGIICVITGLIIIRKVKGMMNMAKKTTDACEDVLLTLKYSIKKHKADFDFKEFLMYDITYNQLTKFYSELKRPFYYPQDGHINKYAQDIFILYCELHNHNLGSIPGSLHAYQSALFIVSTVYLLRKKYAYVKEIKGNKWEVALKDGASLKLSKMNESAHIEELVGGWPAYIN